MMNGAIVVLAFLAVFSAPQQTNGAVSPSTLEEYKPKIVASVEWVKTLLKEVEQKKLHSWTVRPSTDSANRLNVILQDVTLSGASNIEVKSVIAVPKTSTINIVATLPEITIRAHYVGSGVIGGKKASGNGDLVIDVTKTHVLASVKLGTVWNKVKVDSVNLSYDIGGIDVSAENLKIQGTWFFKNNKVAKLLLASARRDSPRLSKVFGEALNIVANAFISGTRLADTKGWVTSFVARRIPLP